MDEIVHLPGPPVKLRPQEARLKWLFGAVRLTSVFSGTEITADAATDSYRRSLAVISTPDICRFQTPRRADRAEDLGRSPSQAAEAGMVALPTN
jgi:hypothetical protein